VKLLDRYLWREITVNFLGVTGVLVAILLVYQGGAVLARAAELQYPSAAVLRLIALGAVQNMTLLLPFGLLLAVILAVGRMYFDNEMFAAQACGMSYRRCQMVVFAVAVPAALLAGTLTLVLAPRAASAEAGLRASALRSALAVPIQAGKFRSLSGGQAVVYARAVSADGELEDVFIKRNLGTSVETTVARRARAELSADGLSQTIVLRDGERQEGVPGSARYRIVRFGEQIIPLVLPVPAAAERRRSEVPTSRLWASDVPADRIELQQRGSWPLMTLLLAIAALPLARLRPRQGRFARIWQAVLLFALYANLLEVAGLWIERGRVAPVWGLWWVHGAFALVALLLWRTLRPWRWPGTRKAARA
jgi:lipopolysaccharide export system permease protein